MKKSEKHRSQKIWGLLAEQYPYARTSLNFRNNFELLVAVILSAQCRDNTVNAVTKILFSQYPYPQDLAVLSPDKLAKLIKPCGLHKTKSKNLVQAAQYIVSRHNGQVPCCKKELLKLPGVGEKTASVILSTGFEIPALAVDTHVHRLANRLGLVKAISPQQTKEQLQKLAPPSDWSLIHHRLIAHGRSICLSKNPRCSSCLLASYCPAALL